MNYFSKFFCISFVASFAFSSLASAADLQSARKAGDVTEKPSGYIAAVKHTPEIEALVTEVNTKRKAEYERIAKEKGQSVESVAAIAAQEISKKH